MGEFKGTPGPWYRGGDENGKVSINAGEYFVALVDQCSAQKSNAHLIAAAPELLEALQNAKFILTLGTRVDYADWRNAIQQCDEAIAKALGETK